LALLGLAQELRGEHTSGLWGLRQVNGDEVRAAHQLFELHQLHAQRSCARWVRVWVIGDDFSFKRCETLCKKLTDVAKANDADGLAEDFYARATRTRPPCFRQRLISLRHP